MHFPINDNAVRNVAGSVNGYAVAEKAFKEGKSVSTTFSVPTKRGKVNTRTFTFINSALLTGEASPELQLDYFGASIDTANIITWNMMGPVSC